MLLCTNLCANTTMLIDPFVDTPDILEVGVTSHAQIRHIFLGCLASFSLFIMFNLCACNVCENRCTITKFSEST